jgi:hypothetical protein
MNRHTKLSVKQPYLSLNKLVFDEVFEFDFFDLSSLQFSLSEVQKQEGNEKFNFEIKINSSKCTIKYSRFQKENEDISLETFEKILEGKGYLIVKPVKPAVKLAESIKPLDPKQFKIEPLSTAQIADIKNSFVKNSFDTRFIPTITTDYLSNLYPNGLTSANTSNTNK